MEKLDLNYQYQSTTKSELLEEISNEINGTLENLKEEYSRLNTRYLTRLVEDFKAVVRYYANQ